MQHIVGKRKSVQPTTMHWLLRQTGAGEVDYSDIDH